MALERVEGRRPLHFPACTPRRVSVPQTEACVGVDRFDARRDERARRDDRFASSRFAREHGLVPLRVAQVQALQRHAALRASRRSSRRGSNTSVPVLPDTVPMALEKPAWLDREHHARVHRDPARRSPPARRARRKGERRRERQQRGTAARASGRRTWARQACVGRACGSSRRGRSGGILGRSRVNGPRRARL